MLASKMSILKPLLESKKGQHLTVYVPNDQNIFQLKSQLRETLDLAYEYLAPVMNPESLVRFLTPIHNTIEDTKLLKNLKGNVALFRNEKSFRILSLPVSVEQTCVLATSFHVKPLLRWIQVDRDFLLLGIHETSASLYQGNQSTFSLVDTIIFPTTLQSSSHQTKLEDLKMENSKILENNEIVVWLNEWLFRLTKDIKPTLFIAGQKEQKSSFLKGYCYESMSRKAISSAFSQEKAADICAEIRAHLKKDTKKELEQALFEFY